MRGSQLFAADLCKYTLKVLIYTLAKRKIAAAGEHTNREPSKTGWWFSIRRGLLISFVTVPEPSSIALLGLGMCLCLSLAVRALS
jgi:hypothetical protein